MELNRRNFFKGVAAGAAFLPSFNILHAEDATIGPKDDQINVALIGFGAEARVLSASLVRIPGVRVRAVCDIWKFQQQQSKQFFKSYGHDVNTYEDYRDMLAKEDKNIDAVVVATPDWMHCEHTCACLRAGKHVYCEKEMSNKLEQAAEIRDEAMAAIREKGVTMSAQSAWTAAAKTEQTLLGMSESGAVTGVDSEDKGKEKDDGGKRPLVMVFQGGGLPPMRGR